MHTKTPLHFFFFFFFFCTFDFRPLKMTGWDTGRPELSGGAGYIEGVREGRWRFLAATSESTGHLGIRSIRACVPVSRFMVASHWNITSLLDRGGEAGVFSPFCPSPSFITRSCNSMKPWNRHTHTNLRMSHSTSLCSKPEETLHTFRCENLTFLLLNLSQVWIRGVA